uniref:Uncharacterized protein n=1 Tax=Quercus lobata TaxID=97700 RepID=A0A7N2QZE9_QUELO
MVPTASRPTKRATSAAAGDGNNRSTTIFASNSISTLVKFKFYVGRDLSKPSSTLMENRFGVKSTQKFTMISFQSLPLVTKGKLIRVLQRAISKTLISRIGGGQQNSLVAPIKGCGLKDLDWNFNEK